MNYLYYLIFIHLIEESLHAYRSTLDIQSNSIENDLFAWLRRFDAELKTTHNMGLITTNDKPSGPQKYRIPM